ncbi:hypothetical protein [Sphingomonas sanguinis]|jgi:hypothetical protein|uniref:Uncharacterized protein n=1 Tax=Sphingomonas sanguinis TaxID=33051 RepID=A0A7Y7QT26_9SPHN|nr:hypothetical protein [Sphingomonas sanguinis]MBZ6380889.1 hypothetical protein [Sphingomonas sanguinis]NNG50320.1 hypothetical protein [Sphingomonas sanguinis]NNG53522.1 hypothetical protein [Sphingomonas sanguinis]NVP30191.1 hypothetical protein [Sphingomonas sanguinis]
MFLVFLSLAAVEAWSPPAQAIWTGEKPSINVQLHGGMVSMRNKAAIKVDLTAKKDGLAVSPFLQPMRGIAFEVRSMEGQPLDPAEPMMPSPPPPPLTVDQLTPVTRAKPVSVVTDELSRTIFPGPGRYKVRAHLFFFTGNSTPARYAEILSDTIEMTVKP